MIMLIVIIGADGRPAQRVARLLPRRRGSDGKLLPYSMIYYTIRCYITLCFTHYTYMLYQTMICYNVLYACCRGARREPCARVRATRPPIYIYIYIYIERERERLVALYSLSTLSLSISCCRGARLRSGGPHAVRDGRRWALYHHYTRYNIL